MYDNAERWGVGSFCRRKNRGRVVPGGKACQCICSNVSPIQTELTDRSTMPGKVSPSFVQDTQKELGPFLYT